MRFVGAPTHSTAAEGHDVSGKAWAGLHVLPGVLAFGMPTIAFCTGTGRSRGSSRRHGVGRAEHGKAEPKPRSSCEESDMVVAPKKPGNLG